MNKYIVNVIGCISQKESSSLNMGGITNKLLKVLEYEARLKIFLYPLTRPDKTFILCRLVRTSQCFSLVVLW